MIFRIFSFFITLTFKGKSNKKAENSKYHNTINLLYIFIYLFITILFITLI